MSMPPPPGFPPIPPRPDLEPTELPLVSGALAHTPVAAAGPTGATWSWAGAIGIFFAGSFLAGFLLALAPGVDLDSDSGFFVSAFVGQVVPTAALLVWLQVSHKTWRAAMGLVRARLSDVGYGVVGGILAYLSGPVGIGMVIALLYFAVTGKQLEAPEQIPVELSGVRILLSILMAVVLAPLVEEFFFRGLVFGGLRAKLGFWPSGLVSAVLFGLAHYDLSPGGDAAGKWFLVIVMVWVGLCFAWLYNRRGTLWTPIAAHVAFNIIGLSLISAS